MSPVDLAFFEKQKIAWAAPPVDGVGYLPSLELLKFSDDKICRMIANLERERYGIDGWRNHKNLWRSLLHGNVEGKRVIDFGCGVGVEALQLARAGATVYVADIVEESVALAERVLALHGYVGKPVLLSGPEPFFTDEQVDCVPLDVFYSSGSVHHIPHVREVLERAARGLGPEGEFRLMLYSDVGWRISTETVITPPVAEPVQENPLFDKFVKTFDYIGGYADWYSAEKLRYRFGDFLDLVRFDYICSDGAYCVATLKKKEGREV